MYLGSTRVVATGRSVLSTQLYRTKIPGMIRMMIESNDVYSSTYLSIGTCTKFSTYTKFSTKLYLVYTYRCTLEHLVPLLQYSREVLQGRAARNGDLITWIAVALSILILAPDFSRRL